MYGLKIAGTDQVSFGPVPVLMVVKVILSTGKRLIIVYITLQVVDLKKKQIQYYDSMGGNNIQCLNVIK